MDPHCPGKGVGVYLKAQKGQEDSELMCRSQQLKSFEVHYSRGSHEHVTYVPTFSRMF
jgi:hypothetical protein